MSRHALLYKHRCRGGPDATRRRRLEQLDKRIELRLGPAGGEDLEQQAGGEAAPLEEEAALQLRASE